jgi:hypothetical protein
MQVTVGAWVEGPAGTATPVFVDLEPGDPADWSGTVASWFLDCPGQSPAWRHYILNMIHLRPIEGVPAAKVTVVGATHELHLAALNPEAHPRPGRPQSWQRLTPLNALEQVRLPGDGEARDLAALAARAVVMGQLPAEPALSGATEPWHTVIATTAEHLRGVHHG